MIYYIVYVSTAKQKLDSSELKKLLTKSQKANQKNEITGMLLYSDGDFIQVIEGEKEKIIKLFHKISQDKRHRQIIKIKAGTWNNRKFPAWSMGGYEIQKEDWNHLPGFKDFNKRKFLAK